MPTRRLIVSFSRQTEIIEMKKQEIVSPEEVKVNCDLCPERKAAIIFGAFFHNLKVRIRRLLKSFFKQ